MSEINGSQWPITAQRVLRVACERMEVMATLLVLPMTKEERELAYEQACAWANLRSYIGADGFPIPPLADQPMPEVIDE